MSLQPILQEFCHEHDEKKLRRLLEHMNVGAIELIGSKIGETFMYLWSILESDLVTNYRFCGSAILTLFKEGDIKDIDVFVVPKDVASQREIVSRLMEIYKHMDIRVNEVPTFTSFGPIHDIKVYQEGKEILDMVFRNDVEDCWWIDCLTCKTGVVKGPKFELFYPNNLLEGKLVIRHTMTQERKSKMLSKGWELVEQ